MRELDTDERALSVTKVDNTLERRNVRIVPDTSVLGRDLFRGRVGECISRRKGKGKGKGNGKGKGKGKRKGKGKGKRKGKLTRPSGTTAVASITIAPIPRVAMDP